MAWGGHMTYNPLTVAWPNGDQVIVSSRTAVAWKRSGNAPGSIDPSGVSTLAWAQALASVQNRASNKSVFAAHDHFGSWLHNMSLARSSDFKSWVSRNVLAPPPSTTTVPTSTTAASTVSPTRDPSACLGVPGPSAPYVMVDGWTAKKVAGNLVGPRGVIKDSKGRLLVVENGKGISQHLIAEDGCLQSSRVLITQNDLNHGICLGLDHSTLYASSATTVWGWGYNAESGEVHGPPRLLVTGINLLRSTPQGGTMESRRILALSDKSQGFRIPQALQFLYTCLKATEFDEATSERVARFILPAAAGQLVRSDIIPMRFRDCRSVETAGGGGRPLQLFHPPASQVDNSCQLQGLLSLSVAGVLLESGTDLSGCDGAVPLEALSAFADADFGNRLSFPWFTKTLLQRKRMVLVAASFTPPSHGGTGPATHLAVIELGIDLVVLHSPGHWLEGPEYAHWREAFISFNLPTIAGPEFVDEIVAAVQSYPKKIDGIMTIVDPWSSFVALAAQKLVLAAESPNFFKVATDKHQLALAEGRQALRTSSAEQALKLISAPNIPYPLIIKPTGGGGLEGVTRVDDASSLPGAFKTRPWSWADDYVIEPYCDGPEVDFNLIMLDSEVVFFEVCDDFPKGADSNAACSGSELRTFIELNSVYPSALPAHDIEVLRNSFKKTLLDLGLRNGVMHLEGRVGHSSVHYQSIGGIVYLHPNASQVDDKKTSAWLIEINPRPIGVTEPQIVESTYGIDYWGVAMSIAVGDKPRARALSQSFNPDPQYVSVMVFIPVDYPTTAEGIFDSDDDCEELLVRRPDLKRYITNCRCFFERGEKGYHPSSRVCKFLAYFNVASRNGRRHALALSQTIREEVRFSFR
ncbi:hypothetical protein GQ53DRAFT_801098 [Thozetella sp. PMI_491]|nr:hypothetical protein GQ53DRAFT_801098 [Thozetella sp. PMI_491]